MLRVDHNIDALQRDLSDMARNQIPFATSRAINDTLDDVAKNETKRLHKTIDRPTPFTLKAWRVARSSKRRLQGAILAKDVQAEYLRLLERPGTRSPDGSAIVVPVRQRLNKYGNMPRKAISRALTNPRVFATTRGAGATSHLPGGIYKRLGGRGKAGRLHMLAAFVDVARYTRRVLRFQESARKGSDKLFPIRFGDRLAEAIRTARR